MELPLTVRRSQDSRPAVYRSHHSAPESLHPAELFHDMEHENSPIPQVPENELTKPHFSKSHTRTLRIWITCALSFVALSPLISVMIGLHLHARDFEIEPGGSAPPFNSRTILMDLILLEADAIANTMTMYWTILGESQSDCGSNTLESCTDVNIFFDNNLLLTDGTQPGVLQTNDRPLSPIFRFNATTFAQQDKFANTATFRTQLLLFSPRNLRSSLIDYPFDSYSAEISMFAQDAGTNETIGIEIAGAWGIAVGFKTHAVRCPGVDIPPGMVDICITLSRGNLVKAYGIIATIAIWMVTIILLLVMLTCVFFGFRQKSEVLIIPVATVFAFTQLRQSMPGAPSGFGDILDFVGLLPCLALLSLTAAMTLGAFLVSDPTAKPHHLNWDILFEAFPILEHLRTRRLA